MRRAGRRGRRGPRTPNPNAVRDQLAGLNNLYRPAAEAERIIDEHQMGEALEAPASEVPRTRRRRHTPKTHLGEGVAVRKPSRGHGGLPRPRQPRAAGDQNRQETRPSSERPSCPRRTCNKPSSTSLKP